MLTFQEAHKLFRYDPATGKLYWRESRGRVKTDDEAGTATRMGYRDVAVDQKKYGVHRLVWLMIHCYWPQGIDHVDGDGLNNRLGNLRLATKSQNQHNRKRSKNNTTGYKGVCYDKSRGKFIAQIMVRNRLTRLGRYPTAALAYAAYCAAADKHHGEFANYG